MAPGHRSNPRISASLCRCSIVIIAENGVKSLCYYAYVTCSGSKKYHTYSFLIFTQVPRGGRRDVVALVWLAVHAGPL